MRKTALLPGLLAVAVCAGQWLEKTIWFYDSFPDLGEPQLVFHNPVTNRMYLSGWGENINIFDANTKTKYAYLDTVWDYAFGAHCYNEHLVYLSSQSGLSLLAFDDRADTIVREIVTVNYEPGPMVYNPVMGKLYVADLDDPRVYVHDAATGVRLDSMGVYEEVYTMAWDSLHNRVYCTALYWDHDEPVQYIDCATDTIAGEIAGTGRTPSFVVHPTRPVLYCIGANDSLDKSVVYLVDTDSLAVVDSIIIPLSDEWDEDGTLAAAEDAGRLYAFYRYWEMDRDKWQTERDSVAVIDMHGDSILAMAELPDDFQTSQFAVNRANGKLYLTSWNYDSTAVVGPDGVVTGFVPGRGEYKAVGWNSSDNEVYVTAGLSWLTVADGVTDSVVHREDYGGFRPVEMFWCPGGNKLYLFEEDTIGVFGRGDSIGKRIPFYRYAMPGEYSSELNRLYLTGGEHRMWVLDCNSDSIIDSVEVVNLYRHEFRIVPGLHKMYVSTGSELYVYDLWSGSFLDSLGWHTNRLAYNAGNGLVYGYDGAYEIEVLDPVLDSVIARVAGQADYLAVNEARNELYVVRSMSQQSVVVVDCGTHQPVELIDLPLRYPGELTWVREHDKVYVACTYGVVAIDCATREVAAVIGEPADRGLRPLYVARNDKLWVQRSYAGPYVIRCRNDSVVARFDDEVDKLAWDVQDNRIYGIHDKRLFVYMDEMTGVSARDEGGGMKAEPRMPTLVRYVLPYRGTSEAVLVDVSGRKVMDLRPGENDVRHLSPGVYFVRQEDTRGTTKVVIQR